MQAYLDNSATTKCAPEVVDVCVKVMSEDYGNPSSKHMKGVEAENYIKQVKKKYGDARHNCFAYAIEVGKRWNSCKIQ